ncbi:MAG TPA: AAA family ATPase, partial [Tahibacter sp.]|nr:AAA family ATPase [Tahibacter sp.]
MQARIAAATSRGEDWVFVAFHPSYAYEDFVGGLRPVGGSDDGNVRIRYEKGPFLKLCEKAHAQPNRTFTLFIDEINRANVAKVFGELITAIEPSKRVAAGSAPQADGVGVWLTLPNTDEPFGVPDNLDIVATMNTADRSIAMMDIALRRRFHFRECAAAPDRIEPRYVGNIDLHALLQRINDRLEFLLDRDHAIGHAYFIGIDSLAALQRILAERVIPLLHEYFFEDLDKVNLVLTGGSKDSVFFRSRALHPAQLFPGDRHGVGTESRRSVEVGDPAAWTERDIMQLYGATPPGEANAASP